jgi:hypothetical protein
VRTRRLQADHQVYWPAFADIMTVVVVVLLCAFAATRSTEPVVKPPTNVTNGGNNEGSTKPPAVTQQQFRSEIGTLKHECLRIHLKSYIKDSISVGEDRIVIGLCKASAAEEKGSLDEICSKALGAVTTILADEILPSISERYNLRIDAIYVLATTGPDSPLHELLNDELKDATRTLNSSLRGGTFRILEGSYREGPETGLSGQQGEIKLVLVTPLNLDLSKQIADLWSQNNWTQLDKLRNEEKAKCNPRPTVER